MSVEEKAKTLSQVEYEMNLLIREKEAIQEKQMEAKVVEFAKILTELPPNNEAELKRVLRVMARDVKHIWI